MEDVGFYFDDDDILTVSDDDRTEWVATPPDEEVPFHIPRD